MNQLSNIFKAYDIRGTVGSELTPDLALKIGASFAHWLPKQGTVAVGRDMRPDSGELANAFIKGVIGQGYDVWDIGEVTSDMIYFAVGQWDLAGGAVITASHNPGKDNGIKLYRDRVVAIGLDSGLSEIRDLALSDQPLQNTDHQGKIEAKTITDEWVNHCLSFLTHLKPFHIAIDAGNGMAGAILPHILPHLPIKVEKMYFDLDGTFPNHEANPQKPENLQDLIKVILQKKLDFGLAFDGDGDRAALVDDLGRPVLGTDMLSLIAHYYLSRYPQAKVVHDVRTSRATIELIREWGGKPVRTKAGRVNIGKVMREVGAPIGGETTGHIFFKENYDADSGLITALVAMQAISDSNIKLSQLIDHYRRYVMIPETNLTVSENQEQIFQRLQAAFPDLKHDYLDGLTINSDDWWFNLRASNTEPVMRLNAEASSQDELDQLVNKIISLIHTP